MTRLLVTCLAIMGLLFVSWTPAAADTYSAVYDTVDAIEVSGNFNQITITGIIAGQGAPSTLIYNLYVSGSSTDAPARCDRLALLAMSKPGKFQFAMNYVSGDGRYTCKLIVRTP